MKGLPAPLTPTDCDLRDVEPPWEFFIEMACHHADPAVRADAVEFFDGERAKWRREHP